MKKKIAIAEILGESFSLYRDNFVLFLPIVLAGDALLIINEILRFMFGDQVLVFVITVPLGLFFSLWASIVLMKTISAQYTKKKIQFKPTIEEAKGQILVYVGVSIMYLLAIVGGMILLILPGIYLGTIFSLSRFIVIFEKKDIMSSFHRSKDLVEGNFWSVMFLFLAPYAFYMLIMQYLVQIQTAALPLQLLFNMLFSIFVMCVYVILYHKLAGVVEVEDVVDAEFVEE